MGDDVINLGVGGYLVQHQRGMGAADDGDDRGVHVLDHFDGLHHRVVVHAHHGQARDVGATPFYLRPEFVPALEAPQVNEVHLEPFGLGAGGELGQAVVDPARLHPLAQALKAIASYAGVD